MFRKPKRKVKEGLRRKETDEQAANVAGTSGGDNNSGGDTTETSELLSEARKRSKTSTSASTASASTAQSQKKAVMHTFDTSGAKDPTLSNADLAVSVAEHHAPDKATDGTAAVSQDGIFRDKQLNKFHAGPIRAAQHVRVTARFDYQPDICKDYKDTGFCGFGDTCIYLHDRGDTMSGWQLEQKWEEEQKLKKEKQEKEMQDFLGAGSGNKASAAKAVGTEDGLPFACHFCREHFKNPVISNCGHYFCQNCVMNHVRKTSELCPVCNKDMHGVFNQPTKLLAKKRRVLGSKKAAADNSWEEFFKIASG
jgi:RING finger protein 113A